MSNYPFSLSVFFPAHNEGENITTLTEKTIAAVSPLCDDFEVIIVNDGSTDNTREIADQLSEKYPQVRVVHHEVNRGYGGAVKTGMKSCIKDWIFFTDGDGQFDISEVNLLLKHVSENDAVVGYRLDRKDPFHRKVFAFCWGTLIKTLFGFRVRDLDCAFKLFKRELIADVDFKAEGAVITVELFSIMTRKNAKIHQVGVHHYSRTAGEQSGGSPLVILRAFKELLVLFKRLKS